MRWAVENKITTGATETTFCPTDPCTRAQLVTFLYRAVLAAGGGEAAGGKLSFEDVSGDNPYYDAILWAYQNGITKGVDGVHFRPGETVTRAQSMTFLFRCAVAYEWEAKDGAENPYEDVADGTDYIQPILWAVENQITKGTDAARFSPDAPCTRGQIVTFLYRYYVS